MPPTGEGELGRLNRPKDIDTAFWLWVGAMVLDIVGVVLAFVMPNDTAREAIRKALEAQGQAADDATINNLLNTGKIGGAVGTAIVVALWLLFVFQMRQAKNWARILLTVVGAISVLVTVLQFGSATPATAVTSIVVSLLVVAAIVFMFRPAANSYFNAFKRAK
jgi:hypothetical protein